MREERLQMIGKNKRGIDLIFCLTIFCLSFHTNGSEVSGGTKNFFPNPSFELGTAYWELEKGGDTRAEFTVDDKDAPAGDYSAHVTLGSVEEWGAQFGQHLEAGDKGKTYTFALFAKAVKKPVSVDLQIERRADPWDRAAKSEKFTLKKNEWTELHITFKLNKDFPQGWFAYISCTQPNAEYRADMFRLYEGEYIPYSDIVKEEMALEGVRLFDTGASSAIPLSGDALLKRPGWTQMPEGEAAHKFKGDAVFLNNRLAVALRRNGPGAEIYANSANGLKKRAVLRPLPAPARQTDTADDLAVKLATIKIVENSPSVVKVDAAFKSRKGNTLAVSYELRIGQIFVKTEPREGVSDLRVEAPCRFAALPDFFADDIVIDAHRIPVPKADLPSENFLLNMMGDGESILMSVWSNREKDVQITVSGEGPERVIDGSDIRYGKDGKIWVALMEAQGIWHTRAVAKDDANKPIRLEWKAPFPAQWRVDWRLANDLTDSWEMAIEKKGGGYVRHGWFGSARSLPPNRRRWTTVLGWFHYPCWIDNSGRGHLQPLLKRAAKFQGPAIIYPINRVQDTPLDNFTVVDLVRQTLGVGPCRYILDVESHKEEYKGRATCATRDKLNAIYSRREQKAKKAEIERALDDVMTFVKHIRGRIEHYVAFGHELLKYLDEQKKAHPEMVEFINEMEKLTRAIDANVARRKEKIKTPAHVAKLTEKFRKELIDYDGEDALKRCKEITSAIVVVGGNQDELVGESRMAVKRLRQRAGLAMATNPQAAEIANEIRRRTREVLRNPTSYEAPRH